jgi:hypothetical protein
VSEQKHLWEIDHPYYCSEGSYFVAGTEWDKVHANWDSWQRFMEDGWGECDEDYNLLFRWDWRRPDPADYEYESEEDPNFKMPGDTLQLFFYLQRKAYGFSHNVAVVEADEPAVREWLTKRAEHLRKVWEPLLDGAA